MSYCLASNQHAVVMDGRAIILDLEHDRYRLLGPPAGRALQGLVNGECDIPVLERLCALGVLKKGQGRTGSVATEPPVASAFELAHVDGSALSFATVSRNLINAMIELKVRSLASVLRDRRAAPGARSGDIESLIPLAQAFGRMRSRLPFRHICLPDSLALHSILTRRGLTASLVIGVRLEPFAAHCWLQSGDLILNDSCDQVARFTPIFAL